jgi:UDP-N-acetylmuramate dehydrogenase
VPHFPAGAAQVKVPAAWLIEQSGFEKGYVMGHVGLSQNHTLAIINRGDAKAADVVALMEKIQAAVKEKFGVQLTPEPVFVGF